MVVKYISIFLITLVLGLIPYTVNALGTASPSADSTSTISLDVPDESVNPTDGISYVFKRALERVVTFFAFSDNSKTDDYKKLLNTRLSELKYIIENKKMAYFEKATQRYFTIAGQLTEYLISKNLSNDYESTRELLMSHVPILTQLRDRFEFGTAEWRFVEDDINYIKEYANNLSN